VNASGIVETCRQLGGHGFFRTGVQAWNLGSSVLKLGDAEVLKMIPGRD
jgi:hypothetical protein